MIDYISDLHLDIQDKGEIEFFNSLVIDDPSETLLIAGDIGEDNQQNLRILKKFKERYENVVIVLGNHDVWITPEHHQFFTSTKRVANAKDIYREEGIIVLDEDIVTINGVRIGGACGWGDLSYYYPLGTPERDSLSFTPKNITSEFFNDDYLKWALQKGDIIRDIAKSSDLLITHCGGKKQLFPEEWQNTPHNARLYFWGEEIDIPWISGHLHEGIESGNCYTNPRGYPFDYTKKNNRIKHLVLPQ